MKRDAVSRCRRKGEVMIGLFGWVLSGCGTVLPPLEEGDGAPPIEDVAQPDEDAGDDAAVPPPDDEAGVSDAWVDPALDVAPTDVLFDVCGDCADARSERGVRDVDADARGGDADVRSADGRDGDGDGASCPVPVNCAQAACNGISCGPNGRVCRTAMCVCPGGQAKETTCGDGADNDCDGLTDCADPDCARLQCGTSTNQRCCGTACANTETDPANCQGCGLACAAGQVCKRIVDASGTRGACTCAATTSQCPRYPAQVCRVGNNDGQDNLCACDFAGTGNAGCAEGQVCVDVTGANFCRY